MTTIKDKPKSAVRTGYGILNRYGDFWSREVFDTPEKLREHFDEFWRSPGFEGKAPAFADYRVVKVRQTLTYIGPVSNGDLDSEAQ